MFFYAVDAANQKDPGNSDVDRNDVLNALGFWAWPPPLIDC
jgi:hypothetical protein